MGLKPVKTQENQEDIKNLRDANKLLNNIPHAFDILNSQLNQLLINQAAIMKKLGL